jgi:hypothetical protein
MAIYTFISHAIPPRVDAAERAFVRWTTANSNMMMSKAREFLREVTPVRTGYMRSQAKTWGYRAYSLGGFRFNLGFRQRDFSGVFYPKFVDQGTGLHGPLKARIYPRKAKRLVWEHDGVIRTAESTAGQKSRDVLAQANKKTYDWMLKWMREGKIQAYRRTIK